MTRLLDTNSFIDHLRRGPPAELRKHRVPVGEALKLQEGRPNLVDLMKNGSVALVINTPSGRGSRTDETRIRASAVQHGVTCVTTFFGGRHLVQLATA